MTEKKEFYKKLSGLMLPLAFQNLMLAAVSAGDSAMLGFVDEGAMSAVALAGNIQFVENLILYAIEQGGTIMIAQYWGKKDKNSVSKLFGLILKYAAAVSVLFFVAALAFPKFLMSLFTNEAVLISCGTEYIRTAALSYLLTGISQCWLCVMRTTGMAKESVAISTGALILDTVLNAIFIFGFDMGVRGVALTTVISRGIELAILLFCTDKMVARPFLEKTPPALNRDFLRYSSPFLINSSVWGVGTTLYSVILGHLGMVITTANAVANIVRQLAISVCNGLCNGGQILLAGVLGSGEMEKARRYGNRLAKLSVLCGFLCALLALVFGFVLSGVMDLSDDVRSTLNTMIYISAFYMLSMSITVVIICGIFAAGGDTAFDAYSVAVTMWLIILPLALLAAFYWKLNPIIVYMILSLDEVIKIPWVYIHYKKYKWLRNITREEKGVVVS